MSNVKFRVDRSRLVSALKTIASAAPSGRGKSRCKPALKAARLSIDDRGFIATATDMEVAAACRIEIAESSGPLQPAERLIDLALLSRLARETARTPTIAIEFPAAGGIRIDALGTLPDVGGEFPSFGELDGFAREFEPIAVWCGIPAELDKAIDCVEFATNQEASRYALGAILVEFCGGRFAAELATVGTDGRRLAVARISAAPRPANFSAPAGYLLDPALRNTEPSAAFLLPHKAAIAFSAAIRSAGRAELVAVLELLQRKTEPAAVQPEPADGNQASKPAAEPDRRLRLVIADKAGNVRAVLSSREIAGRFPNWRQVTKPADRMPLDGFIAADGSAVAAFKAAIAVLPADNRCSRFAVRNGRGFLIGQSRINGKFCGRFNGRKVPPHNLVDQPRESTGGRFAFIDPALLFPWLQRTEPAAGSSFVFTQPEKNGAIHFFAGGGAFEFVLMPMAGGGRVRRS